LSQDEMQTHLTELVEQSAHGGPTLPSLDVVPVLVPQDDDSAAEETMPLDRGTVQTLLAIDGVRSVRGIISARGSFEVLWQVANLAQLGLVRLPGAEPTPSRSGPAEKTPVRPGRAGPAAASAVPLSSSRTHRTCRNSSHLSHPSHPSHPYNAPAPVNPLLTARPACRGSRRRDDRHTPERDAPHCPKLGFDPPTVQSSACIDVSPRALVVARSAAQLCLTTSSAPGPRAGDGRPPVAGRHPALLERSTTDPIDDQRIVQPPLVAEQPAARPVPRLGAGRPSPIATGQHVRHAADATGRNDPPAAPPPPWPPRPVTNASVPPPAGVRPSLAH
jgi:hypothetical protein